MNLLKDNELNTCFSDNELCNLAIKHEDIALDIVKNYEGRLSRNSVFFIALRNKKVSQYLLSNDSTYRKYFVFDREYFKYDDYALLKCAETIDLNNILSKEAQERIIFLRNENLLEVGADDATYNFELSIQERILLDINETDKRIKIAKEEELDKQQKEMQEFLGSSQKKLSSKDPGYSEWEDEFMYDSDAVQEDFSSDEDNGSSMSLGK